MTGSSEQLLPQRAQYVANGIAVGIVSINPDPARPAVRLVLRDLTGSGGGPAERQLTARPGDVFDCGTRRLTLTAVVTGGPAAPVGHIGFRDEPGLDDAGLDHAGPDGPRTGTAS